MKYLLTNGTSTNKVEEYVIDLYRIYLKVYINDIPGALSIGSNFILNNIKKNDLATSINSTIVVITNTIKKKIGSRYEIKVDSIEVIDEEEVKLTITVNELTNELIVNI